MYHCTCTSEGYDANCPNVFYQNGQRLHTIDNETQLKPKRYLTSGEDSVTQHVSGDLEEASAQLERTLLQPLDASHSDFDESDRMNGQGKLLSEGMRLIDQAASESYITPKQLDLGLREISSKNQSNFSPLQGPVAHRRITDEKLLQMKNVQMNKYESLRVSGNDFNQFTIGGYRMDVDLAQNAVKRVLPLPPVQLPVIFTNAELNFLHHFFSGLDTILTRPKVHELVNARKYYANDNPELIRTMCDLITEGKVNSDTQLTILVKRVLNGTFSIGEDENGELDTTVLKVSANLWGFEYIEAGMECREEHCRMWLSMAYQKYKLVWSNEFKVAGIPSFALDGVQLSDRQKPKAEIPRAHVTPPTSSTHKLKSGHQVRRKKSTRGFGIFSR